MVNSSKLTPTLEKAYQREVKAGLFKIKKALSRIKDGPKSRADLAEIQVIAKSISELAMIHGYQGVESISRKIYTSIRQFPFSITFAPAFLFKIEEAVKGIQDVVSMEKGAECKMTVESVVSKKRSIFDEMDEQQRRIIEIETDSKLLFDIKESALLITPAQTATNQDSRTNPSKNTRLPS